MKRFILIFLGFSMLAISCEKDELTIPVNVDFVISMENNDSGEYLDFSAAEITLEDIIFQGERQEGEDVYFTSNPDIIYGPINFYKTQAPVYITHFDIPQGFYTLMNWSFTLSFLDIDNDLDDEMDDDTDSEELDDEFGLVFSGIYTNLIGDKIPIIIGVEDEEKFSMHAETYNESYEINLEEKNYYNANLIFDLGSVFQSISRESIETATLSSDNEIIITSDINETLYELILFRLEKTSKVVFSVKPNE